MIINLELTVKKDALEMLYSDFEWLLQCTHCQGPCQKDPRYHVGYLAEGHFYMKDILDKAVQHPVFEDRFDIVFPTKETRDIFLDKWLDVEKYLDETFRHDSEI